MAARTPGGEPSRRALLGVAAGAIGLAADAAGAQTPAPGAPPDQMEPFFRRRQSGIVTPPQSQVYFAAFDLDVDNRDALAQLLKDWTATAARLATGQPAPPPQVDSGETSGLRPARLTLTFGFGPGVFSLDGRDRYGLARLRPAAMIDLPSFPGDQLEDARTGGDIALQVCADEPQVAFHALRTLAQTALGRAKLRWLQSGFRADFGANATPRNLLGFKDGINNPSTADPELMNRFIWIGDEGGAAFQDGSYLVARVIRIALEHWDATPAAIQERVLGRSKSSGAPLGQAHETDPVNLDALDKGGLIALPANSHVRLAAPQNHAGARILRRSYSYDNGLSFAAERRPPWRQGLAFDAGLLFLCYQRDPRAGFVSIFDSLSKYDALGQFTTHVGSGLFLCPPGAREGGFIGESLFAAA